MSLNNFYLTIFVSVIWPLIGDMTCDIAKFGAIKANFCVTNEGERAGWLKQRGCKQKVPAARQTLDAIRFLINGNLRKWQAAKIISRCWLSD